VPGARSRPELGCSGGVPIPMLAGIAPPRSSLVLIASLGAALASGCASAPPPKPVVAEEAPPAAQAIDTGPTSLESEIGGMNEDAVEKKFRGLMKPIIGCFEGGSTRVEQIGGSFTVSFRVDRAGKTRWAYMKASTIGDRGTESCILDLVRNEPWPKPLSGEGLAEKTMEIEPSKAPHTVDVKRMRTVVKLAQKRAATCRNGVRGAFLATVYLEPNGRVRTAGVATPNEKGDAVADCITSEIQKLKFTPTGKLAKVSFEM
jgi:hypothetical protein